MAVGDDLGVAVELAQPLGQLAQGNQPGPFDVRDVPLVRLANVDQDQVPRPCPPSPARSSSAVISGPAYDGSAPMPQKAS